MTCKSCPKRETCRELCAEVEKHISKNTRGIKNRTYPVDINHIGDSHTDKNDFQIEVEGRMNIDDWDDKVSVMDLREAVKGLVESDQVIINMVLDGYTQEEIGRDVGISHQSVSKRIKKIKEELKGKLCV